jgi:hypothetical protein
MTKFKVPASLPKVAPGEAQPPPGPQQESQKPKERRPIHPGLGFNRLCLKCGTHLAFREPEFAQDPLPLSRPFNEVWLSFCECGIWTMNQRGEIRWVRYSSGIVRPGEGEVFAP